MDAALGAGEQHPAESRVGGEPSKFFPQPHGLKGAVFWLVSLSVRAKNVIVGSFGVRYSFTVIRNGQPVARIEKARQVSGDTLKDAFRRHAADPALAEELRELRSLIATDANQ